MSKRAPAAPRVVPTESGSWWEAGETELVEVCWIGNCVAKAGKKIVDTSELWGFGPRAGGAPVTDKRWRWIAPAIIPSPAMCATLAEAGNPSPEVVRTALALAKETMASYGHVIRGWMPNSLPAALDAYQVALEAEAARASCADPALAPEAASPDRPREPLADLPPGTRLSPGGGS